jgi:nucleotide-binding universal stress UspA family protein
MASASNAGEPVFRRIVIGTDGSDNAKRAIHVASDLARRTNAEVVIAYAIPSLGLPVAIPPVAALPAEGYAVSVDDYYKEARDRARKLVGEAVELAKEGGVRARGEVLDGPESVVEQLVGLAEKEKVDLVCVGTRGHSGFRKLLLGSVSNGLVSHAPCTVLVVR